MQFIGGGAGGGAGSGDSKEKGSKNTSKEVTPRGQLQPETVQGQNLLQSFREQHCIVEIRAAEPVSDRCGRRRHCAFEGDQKNRAHTGDHGVLELIDA